MTPEHKVAAALLLILSGCGGAFSGGSTDPEEARRTLMQADLDFATAAADRGLEGWMSRMAPDAVRLVLGQPSIRGSKAIAEADSVLFTPGIRLTWEPVDAGLLAGGTHGFTTGTYDLWRAAVDGSEVRASTGSYITIWWRDATGDWQIALDGGAAGELRSDSSSNAG